MPRFNVVPKQGEELVMEIAGTEVSLTVTVTAAVATDSHATEFSVDMVILRYCVVAVKPEGTS
jgi:hypothetical protein